MALPKYKTSRANTHSRRANWKASAVQTVTCPNCGSEAFPHMACPSCGTFRGRVYREAVRSAHTKQAPSRLYLLKPCHRRVAGFFFCFDLPERFNASFVSERFPTFGAFGLVQRSKRGEFISRLEGLGLCSAPNTRQVAHIWSLSLWLSLKALGFLRRCVAWGVAVLQGFWWLAWVQRSVTLKFSGKNL